MSSRTIRTLCNLCGRSACGVEAIVENNTVVKISGDKSHPESRGYICAKGQAISEILYAPDRLKQPLKRIGNRGEGKWQEISWDEAYDLISKKLHEIKKTYGPEAVWFHKGSSHDVAAGEVSRAYLHRLANVFGTPNLSCQFNICYGPRVVPMVHTLGAIFAPDVEKTKCILLWGINPTVSAPIRNIKILEALKKGAKLICIDPRVTFLAEKADLHLQPRPGTDGALALGLLKIIIADNLYNADFVDKWTTGFTELKEMLQDYSLDEIETITGVAKNEIRKAAYMYATSKPACLITGNGLDQDTGSTQTVRAISILMAITGNLDVPGGNVLLPPSSTAKNSVPLHEMLPKEAEEKRLGNELLITRFEYTKFAHPNTAFGAVLEEKPYPVKALLVVASNIMLSCLNSQRVKEALEKLEFLVVTELFMTETAKLADLVLPACTYLEQTYYATYEAGADIKPSGSGLLMLRPQVIPPLHETKPDWQIIFDLAKKMGYEKYFPWQSIEEAISFELEPTGITYEDLLANPNGVRIKGFPILYQKFGKKGAWGKLIISLLNATVFRKYPDMYYKYRKMGFMTPSKKVEILSQTYQKEGLDSLPVYREAMESPLGNPELAREYPLVLTTVAKVDCYIHSHMRNIPSLRRHMPKTMAEIHPDTAGSVGINDGDAIIVETLRAGVKCIAKVTNKIRPNTVLLYFGFSEASANLLTDDTVWDPVTGSSPARSALCRVIKAGLPS